MTHARKVRTWKRSASLGMSVLCVSHRLELQCNPACVLSKLRLRQGEHSEEESSGFGHTARPSTGIRQIFPGNQILQNNVLGLLFSENLLSPKLTGALQSSGLSPGLGLPTTPRASTWPISPGAVLAKLVLGHGLPMLLSGKTAVFHKNAARVCQEKRMYVWPVAIICRYPEVFPQS